MGKLGAIKFIYFSKHNPKPINFYVFGSVQEDYRGERERLRTLQVYDMYGDFATDGYRFFIQSRLASVGSL